MFFAVSATGRVGRKTEIIVTSGSNTLLMPLAANRSSDNIGARSTTPSARFSSCIAAFTTTKPPMLMPKRNVGSS